MSRKYGKIAVVFHAKDVAGHAALKVLKADFEPNHKVVAQRWIKERGVAPGEKLQIVRLSDIYENKEVTTREVVVSSASDADVTCTDQVDIEDDTAEAATKGEDDDTRDTPR